MVAAMLQSVLDLFRSQPTYVIIAIAVLGFSAVIISHVVESINEKELEPALQRKWIDLPLVKKVQLTHNTYLFRFALPLGPRQPLGLPIGQHVRLRAIDKSGKPMSDDQGQISRSYTPTSPHYVRGHVDFVIKIYPKGRFTQWLDKISVGDKVSFNGPLGQFKYHKGDYTHLGMVAGGTGVAPMFQVMQAILSDKTDSTKLSLVFGNITEEDILLRQELDAMAEEHPDRVKIYYVLDKPPAGWKGGEGYITKGMLKEHMPAPGDGVKILRCGPPGMLTAVKGHLDALSYPADAQFEF